MNNKAILGTLNLIQSLLGWLEARSVVRDDVIALLDQARLENRDITIEDVQSRLDIVADELDQTENLINQD